MAAPEHQVFLRDALGPTGGRSSPTATACSGSLSDAEDLAQETVVRVAKAGRPEDENDLGEEAHPRDSATS
jgi:DNA-directed RNA polymerase specialized sigma24 family protein